MVAGHLGEWIASQVFDIELETSAATAAIDGRFRSGPLLGKTVNIKWYLKREGLLDMTLTDTLDYYLVMTGPAGAPSSSAGRVRPWLIDDVYLFDARQLSLVQQSRGVKVGPASSVPSRYWAVAEIFPNWTNPLLQITPEQSAVLGLFKQRE